MRRKKMRYQVKRGPTSTNRTSKVSPKSKVKVTRILKRRGYAEEAIEQAIASFQKDNPGDSLTVKSLTPILGPLKKSEKESMKEIEILLSESFTKCLKMRGFSEEEITSGMSSKKLIDVSFNDLASELMTKRIIDTEQLRSSASKGKDSPSQFPLDRAAETRDLDDAAIFALISQDLQHSPDPLITATPDYYHLSALEMINDDPFEFFETKSDDFGEIQHICDDCEEDGCSSDDSESPGWKCSICLSKHDGPRTSLPCMDTFHTHCITTWLSKHDTCPNCRTNIRTLS